MFVEALLRKEFSEVDQSLFRICTRPIESRPTICNLTKKNSR